uniref:Transmembrane protein n=1 Tax=Kalanchoe fedtschenkoi TaxID=63787 RepID=A0A7N0V4R8_KALFE
MYFLFLSPIQDIYSPHHSKSTTDNMKISTQFPNCIRSQKNQSATASSKSSPEHRIMDNPNSNPSPENHYTDISNINDDWEHIQSQPLSSSSSDDHLSIFPPSLHQDLNITTPLPLSIAHQSESSQPTSPSSSISSRSSDPEPKAWILTLICRRLRLRLVVLKLQVANLGEKLYSFVTLRKAGVVLAVLVAVSWLQSRRRRVAAEDVSRLRKLIKEKDRVIDQLLLEIAQMREESSGRRTVPVYRVR